MRDFHQAIFSDDVPDLLMERRYRDTDVYPIIKMVVGAWREESKLPSTIRTSDSNSCQLKFDFKKWFTSGDVWALFGSSSRFLQINGKPFAPHIDSLLELLPAGISYKSFVNPNSTGNANGSADRAWSLLMLIAKRMGMIISRIDPQLRKLHNDILLLGASVSESKSLVRTVGTVHWGSVLLSCFIFRRPKFALVICFYNIAGLIFVRALKRHGVPVYDVQHGTMGTAHFAYRPIRHYPSESYNSLPTGFLCWSEAQALSVKSNLAGAPCTHAIGYPLEFFLTANPEAFGNVKLPFAGQVKCVLITVDERNDPLLVADIIRQNPGHNWMIRLHPTQKHLLAVWKEKFKAEKNVEIELSTLAPLMLLWPQVEIHITAYSSVAIEAAMNGVSTYFWSPLASDMYPDLFLEGQGMHWTGQLPKFNAASSKNKKLIKDWYDWCEKIFKLVMIFKLGISNS